MKLRSIATVAPLSFVTALAPSLFASPAAASRAVWTSDAASRLVTQSRTVAMDSPSALDALDDSSKADALLGEWWTEGKEGRVKIVKTKSGRYEVLLLDGKDVDKPDVENPDPKLRERKLRGIVLMWNLRFDDGEYVDGYCYNPRDGETYRVKMRITGPSTLTLRGYLAVPLLGQSQDWTRAN